MLILFSYGNGGLKSALPTLFRFGRVRAVHQLHVSETFLPICLKMNLSTYFARKIVHTLCLNEKISFIDYFSIFLYCT